MVIFYMSLQLFTRQSISNGFVGLALLFGAAVTFDIPGKINENSIITDADYVLYSGCLLTEIQIQYCFMRTENPSIFPYVNNYSCTFIVRAQLGIKD